MANVTKRRIVLTIVWDKGNPDNLRWGAACNCIVPDDKEPSGEESFVVKVTEQEITRAQFRTITGQQIENTVVGAIDDAIQALGSGAGTHTINDDTGN